MTREEFDGLYANKESLWEAWAAEQEAKDQALTESLTRLEALGALPDAPVTVSVNGAGYKILAKKINVKGQVYSAQELKENPALAQLLVDSGSGMLEPLNKH